MAKDYYATLGVNKSATQDEIKAAFRKAAHTHHPDKGEMKRSLKEMNEAYQVLGDGEKRAKYDQFGSAAFDGSGGGGFPGGGFDFSQAFGGGAGFDASQFGDLGDILGGMFGGGGRQQRGGKPHGQDLAFDLSLSFKESVFGVERKFRCPSRMTAERCGGVGAEPATKMKKCTTCNGQGFTVAQQRTFLGRSRCGWAVPHAMATARRRKRRVQNAKARERCTHAKRFA